MEIGESFATFRDTSGIAGMELLRIFNDLHDYICVHSVQLDAFGDVADAHLRAWNRSYEAVRTKKVEVGQSMQDTYFKPELALDFVNKAWHEGVAHQVFRLAPATRDRYRPEGAMVYINVLWQRVGDFVVEVGNDLSEVRRLQMQLADEESAATAALHARIVAEERERIARDLHDSAIQQLFASALQLNTLSDAMPQGLQQETVRRVADTLSNVIAEIRSGIVAVRSDVPSSLHREIEDVVGFIANPAGVHWTVTVDDDLDPAGEIRSNLRVAVRESVSNAVRHGHGAQVRISVQRREHHVELRISDDGVGVPVEIERSSGLSNLRRRAEDLGGSMTIADGEDGGTVVLWRVPLPAGEEG